MAACQLVGAHMARQRSGVVVNIGSVAGYLGLPQAAAYCCSKQAVRAFSDALRVELAPFGVRVMHVALGEARGSCVLAARLCCNRCSAGMPERARAAASSARVRRFCRRCCFAGARRLHQDADI